MKINLLHILFIIFVYSCAQEPIASVPEVIQDPLLRMKQFDKQVGAEIELGLAAKNKAALPITFVFSNGLIHETLDATTNKIIKYPQHLSDLAGVHTISAYYNNEIVAKEKFLLANDQIVDPLEIYTGPNSILVGQKQKSMVVSIPADKYDNGIISNEKITYNTTRKDKEKRPIKNLISYTQLYSSNKSNKILVGTSLSGVASKEQSIEEIADWPNRISLKVINHHPFADNRQYVRVKTEELKDKFGNQVADGTLVHILIFNEGKLISTYNAVTIDGIANCYFRNPDKPCTWTIQAKIGNAYSKIIPLRFKQNLKSLDIEFNSNSNQVIAGPLISTLGQHISDGSLVRFYFKDFETQIQTESGMATLDLNEYKVSHLDSLYITVSGYTQKITIK